MLAHLRTIIQQGNRLGSAHPQIYTSVVASAGTLAWGAFVVARKIRDGRPFAEDMSAITGDSLLVKEARFRVYGLDDQLSYHQV